MEFNILPFHLYAALSPNFGKRPKILGKSLLVPESRRSAKVALDCRLGSVGYGNT
jgi:hypothetical protein